MDKWYRCPRCKKKLILYNRSAQAKGIFLMCKNCKGIIEIKINAKN